MTEHIWKHNSWTTEQFRLFQLIQLKDQWAYAMVRNQSCNISSPFTRIAPPPPGFWWIVNNLFCIWLFLSLSDFSVDFNYQPTNAKNSRNFLYDFTHCNNLWIVLTHEGGGDLLLYITMSYNINMRLIAYISWLNSCGLGLRKTS